MVLCVESIRGTEAEEGAFFHVEVGRDFFNVGVIGCEVLGTFEADAAVCAIAEAEIIFAAPDGEIVLRGKSFAGVAGDFVAVEADVVKKF